MQLTKRLGGITLGVIATIAFLAAGCDKEGGQAQNKEGQGGTKRVNDKKAHDHSGWWCEEHGIPEKLCSLCNSEAAAKFKSEGDWCKIHDRAKSQCFKCEPKLYEKYAAMYQAKFGNAPPRPPETEFQK
jgi:hypothetical protein